MKDEKRQVTFTVFDVRQLAKAIAADLFTNVNGATADRIMLMKTEEYGGVHDLGGWSLSAVADRIEAAILNRLRP